MENNCLKTTTNSFVSSVNVSKEEKKSNCFLLQIIWFQKLLNRTRVALGFSFSKYELFTLIQVKLPSILYCMSLLVYGHIVTLQYILMDSTAFTSISQIL